jgi:hypothetical protein
MFSQIFWILLLWNAGSIFWFFFFLLSGECRPKCLERQNVEFVAMNWEGAILISRTTSCYTCGVAEVSSVHRFCWERWGTKLCKRNKFTKQYRSKSWPSLFNWVILYAAQVLCSMPKKSTGLLNEKVQEMTVLTLSVILYSPIFAHITSLLSISGIGWIKVTVVENMKQENKIFRVFCTSFLS